MTRLVQARELFSFTSVRELRVLITRLLCLTAMRRPTPSAFPVDPKDGKRKLKMVIKPAKLGGIYSVDLRCSVAVGKGYSKATATPCLMACGEGHCLQWKHPFTGKTKEYCSCKNGWQKNAAGVCTRDCPQGCSGHGTYNGCVCNAMWGGKACDEPFASESALCLAVR